MTAERNDLVLGDVAMPRFDRPFDRLVWTDRADVGVVDDDGERAAAQFDAEAVAGQLNGATSSG